MNEATSDNRHFQPFNTPVETGLRTLCILFEAYPAEYDLQRIIFLDYLLVHSGDAPNGPKSIHPPTPFRSNEFLVRRRLIEDGVHLMTSRGLIEVRATDSGFAYRLTENAGGYLTMLQADYTRALRDRAAWLVTNYGQSSDDALSDFFNKHLDRWGSEFELIADFEGDDNQ